MKKTLRMFLGMLMVAVLALPLASCSDDDDATKAKKDVYGTWVHSAGNTNYTYVFNEDGNGTVQEVTYADNEYDSTVKSFKFKYTLSDPDEEGFMNMTITPEGGTAQSFKVIIRNGKLYINNDAFDKATVSKDIVGTWVMQVEETNDAGQKLTSTVTYEFKKDGTGKGTWIEFNQATGVTDTSEYTFKYTLTTEENENGFRILITTDDEDGEETTYNVTINGDVLTMDQDTLFRKKK